MGKKASHREILFSRNCRLALENSEEVSLHSPLSLRCLESKKNARVNLIFNITLVHLYPLYLKTGYLGISR